MIGREKEGWVLKREIKGGIGREKRGKWRLEDSDRQGKGERGFKEGD